MVTAARDRLARTLRGDAETAFSVELTAKTGDLSLAVEGAPSPPAALSMEPTSKLQARPDLARP
jgi:hypothetical protein